MASGKRRSSGKSPADAERLRVLEKAVVPVIRFYDLRHTHASILLAHGESIKAVSSRLGHSDVALTLRVYAHLLPDADNSLAETAQKAFG